MNILEKYAHLLVHYCLDIKPGEKLFIQTTTLAEELVREVYKVAMKAGAYVEYQMSFQGQNSIFVDEASDEQLEHVPETTLNIMKTFDAFLSIRAPFDTREDQNIDVEKSAKHKMALAAINAIYSERTANKSLKRCLCQFPTLASATEAKMSLDEYSSFVFNACHLYKNDPQKAWEEIGESQQKYVDFLNTCDNLRYLNDRTDISFSVNGRKWMNSDGKNNMPSGEVFTSPVEETVNGHAYFNYPSVYMGHEVEGIKLNVADGEVVSWDANKGKEFLDQIFKIEGARSFGEVAIGTNYNIKKATKNILFDEKIGGTVHMAIGQSYLQTGGKNHSTIHWDMITDMKEGGEIFADGICIYQNGNFII